MPIDDKLVNLLKKDFTLIGNGLEKLNKISEFKFIKTKTLGPTKLYSNYFVKRIYNKKYSMKFPKIIYRFLIKLMALSNLNSSIWNF